METIGKSLKEKRLALGLTIEEVNAKTRLTQKHIKALEEGDINFFHEDLAYLRFFVKAYCDALDVDFETIKNDLKDAVNEYTETISINKQLQREEIERSVQKKEKLSKVANAQNSKTKNNSMKRNSGRFGRRRPDISLLSLIIIGALLIVFIIAGLVVYMNSVQKEAPKTSTVFKQPIAKVQKNKDKKSSQEASKDKQQKLGEKTLEIIKTSVTQYALEGVQDGDKLTFELYFGGSTSGLSIVVDGKVLSDPPSRVYEYKSTVNAAITAKQNMKIIFNIGWMNNVTLKINENIIKIDDTIASSNTSQTLEFNVVGVKQ